MTPPADSSGTGKARLLLMKEAHGAIDPEHELSDLLTQLCSLSDFHDVELKQNGRSTVLALVPATNKRQIDRMKSVAMSKLRGWRVIDEQSYSLPTTF
jgi:hypothetical protein